MIIRLLGVSVTLEHSIGTGSRLDKTAMLHSRLPHLKKHRFESGRDDEP